MTPVIRVGIRECSASYGCFIKLKELARVTGNDCVTNVFNVM